MLVELAIKHLAIIEDLEVTFSKGMTALTGQTGAGKSLLIDAIGLLLGERADQDLIRHGESKAFVKGVFRVNNEKLEQLLASEGIPIKETLTLFREIQTNAKNTIKINDQAVTLTTLKSVANKIADIHVQHQTQRLIHPESYLELVDAYDQEAINPLFNAYQVAKEDYLQAVKKYQQAKLKNQQLTERIDMLRFTRDELIAQKLVLGEKEMLESHVSKLSNHDKIYNQLLKAYQLIDNEYFSVDRIIEAYQAVHRVEDYDVAYKDIATTLKDAYYALDPIIADLKSHISELDFDPEDLNRAQTRIFTLEKLEKKYGKNEAELLDYLKEIQETIAMHEDYDGYLDALHNALKDTFAKAEKTALSLSKKRQQIALALSKALVNECLALDLEKAKFEIAFLPTKASSEFDTSYFLADGVDKIDFMISLNEGEPLKSLSKTASGGELSRIMLAFKTIFAHLQGLSVMIFDEIDAGISGLTAAKVAKKMKQLSSTIQVLAITHLAQVAAAADAHVKIYKVEKDKRTTTHVSTLDKEARIVELASMLSGERISAYALEHAKELRQEYE